MNSIPLWKSHYSLGKSILNLEKPSDNLDVYPLSIFSILKKYGLDTLTLVEENISGLLQASKYAAENKIKLIYGLRISISEDVNNHVDDFNLKQAKYIIFCKNTDGYKDLIKIWSFAAKEGFYYYPSLDWKNLKRMWTDNLILSVPFYDSFLHLNTLESHIHVPDFSFYRPIFFTEKNGLPFDYIIQNKVNVFCETNGLDVVSAQSIYYYSPNDFEAYLTFRCIHSRGGGKKTTCERPELNHMCSDEFNFLKWWNLNK